ncbi:hypothetical protein HanPI659440_Chr08g0311141 [Helianthus annuus]|nr:hypothetical protein HanPI659440_Chr08g0311141 [Helianthus annuus]
MFGPRNSHHHVNDIPTYLVLIQPTFKSDHTLCFDRRRHPRFATATTFCYASFIEGNCNTPEYQSVAG